MWWRRSPSDFREEIEAHLALEARALERERGLSADEALREARRRFGNAAAAHDRFAESRRMRSAARVAQHVTYAVRMLGRQPGFAVAAIATLAIGIGLLTSGFTLFYGFLFRPLPVHDADRLVHIDQQWVERAPGTMMGGATHSWDDYLVYRDLPRPAARALASIAVYTPRSFAVAGLGAGVGEEVDGALVSCDYFATAGARPAIGRMFMPDECEHPGDGDVVVVGHRLWTRHFGADSSVVGRTVRINNVPVTVVGVAEPAFAGVLVEREELWIPATLAPTLAHGRDSMIVHPDAVWLRMIGRLAPGATPEQAGEELRIAARGLDERSANGEGLVRVRPARYAYFDAGGSDERISVMFVLLGIVVVLMACVNVMNLLLARAVARRREIGIRLAVGASRARLIEQLLVESVVLALAAGVVGFGLAHVVPGIVRVVEPVREFQVNLVPDAVVLGFALLLALATVLLFGLAPALQATGVELTSAMRGAFAFGARSIRLAQVRTAMVACQIAGSTLLLVMTGLLMRSALATTAVDPGIDPRNVFSASLGLSRLGYGEESARAVHEQLVERLVASPGVVSVATADYLPLGGGGVERITPEAGPGAATTGVLLFYNRVSSTYLETLRLPLLRGRTFTDAEARSSEPVPSVVSATAARQLWPEADALGRLFRLRGRLYRVVGIAGDAGVATQQRMVLTIAYLPADRAPYATIIARTSGATTPVAAAVTEWARVLDPAIVVRTETMEDRLDRLLAPSRIRAGLAATLGVIALLLAVVGIYGVVSFATTQRRREVAVRMALGATRVRVVALMMRQGAWATGIGLGIGILLAAAASHAMRSMLYGIGPLDPLSYAAMGGAMLAAAAVAMFLPSRRAARVDPARELREE